MKTKLFTRNLCLGVLMTLVLVFGVQGIADALTLEHRSNGGNYQTVLPGGTFTISFTMRQAGSATNKLNHFSGSGVTGMPYYLEGQSPNVSGYHPSTVTDEDPRTDGDQAGDDTAVSTAAARYYNDKALAITFTGLTLKKGTASVTSRDASRLSERASDTASLGDYSLHEAAPDSNLRLSSTITLTGTAAMDGTLAAANSYTITITDVTPTDDFPMDNPAPGTPSSISFTIYVVRPAHSLTTRGTTLASGSDGIYCGFKGDEPQINDDFGFTSTPANHAPVYYSVQGSGRLEVGSSPPRLRISNGTLTSSEAPVYLTNITGTNVVTAYVAGTTPKTVIYVYTDASSPARYPRIETTGGDNQVGVSGGRLEDYLEVKVTDGGRRPIPGVAVQFATGATEAAFIPVPGTTVYTTSVTDSNLIGTVAEPLNAVTKVATSTVPPKKGTPVFVQTDRSGLAKIYYEVGTEDTQAITATFVGEPCGIQPATFTMTKTTDRVANLVILSGNPQNAAKGQQLANPLVVIARSTAGHRIPNVVIQFRTNTGTLSRHGLTEKPLENGRTGDTDPAALQWGEIPANTPNPDNGQQIYVITGPDGQASVNYNVGQLVVAREIDAEIRHEPLDSSYSFAIDRVTFNVNGRASTRDADDADDADDTNDTPTVTVNVPPSVSGTAGGTATLRVTAAANADVTAGGLGDTFLRANVGSFTRSGTIHSSILTLPDQAATYSLTVFVDNVRYPVTVRVSQATAQARGTLDIQTDVSGGPGESKPVTITVTNTNGTAAAEVTVRLRITAGGGSFSPASVTTGDNGTATSTFTRGSTAGSNYFISATTTPSGYDTADSRGIRITIASTAPPQDESPTDTADEASAIDVYDGDGQRGTPNVQLAEMLVVEVTDADGNPVSGERVTFRTTIGSGRFSPARPRTNGNGRAQTWFTPTSSGTLRIAASVAGVSARAVFRITTGAPPASLTKVSGDSQSGTPSRALANPFVVEVKDEDGEVIEGIRVSFSVTSGGGSLSETSATTDEEGRAETTLTLGSERGVNSVQASVSGVDPVTFSTSIDAKILVAAANRPVMYWIAGGALYRLAGAKEAKIAESANGVAIGGGKVYWTAATGRSGGTINSANLDGSGATQLTSIFATPIGIAVDTAGSKLYWTNSSGRIQSANLNGSGIKNVLQNLSNPTDIVVSGGFIYWTQDGNTIRRVNIRGQRNARDVAANLDTVGGLAVGGGKVYWTEQTSASAGTVNGANLNGTNFETLATLLSAPMGISVDTANSKLYWTNSRGRVQSANLDGSRIRNVVDGLISPSQLVIGSANAAEAVTKQPSQPAKKDTSAYDVNGDGKVDNVDASLVASGLDTGNAKYDVNKDGAVNFLDLLLIFDNRDADAAGAPTILGVKLSTVQIDRIQTQIDLLVATNDRSPAAMRTLVYLQQLIATARPAKTQLLANYPNPFNPETWMPYELATDTNVRITIYNTHGVIIRTLELGHQSAGYYTGRDRAAYWDGRNALGEQVASGIYFYQLETDEMSTLRKMVILK